MRTCGGLPAVAIWVWVPACSCDEQGDDRDGGAAAGDAGADAGPDAATDAGVDGAPDSGPDGGPDAGAVPLEPSLHELRGAHQLAGILLTFEDNAEPTDTPEELRRRMFTSARSLNAFYGEVSYGRFWLEGALDPEGDVFGPVEVPYPQKPCDREAWAAAAQLAAAEDGFDVASYDYLGYFFPGPCGSMGRPGWTPPSALMGNSSLRAQAHEMGHAFGLAHSSSLVCDEDGVRVALGGTCEVDEYGDVFDVMGGSGTYMPNGRHRGTLGWLEPSNTLTVVEDGSYGIEPIELPTEGVQVLRVPRMVGADRIEQFTYIELRQPASFDDFPADAHVVQGVLIRLAGGYDVGGRTYLLDMHPETVELDDAALLGGEAFLDEATGLELRVVEVGPTGATVQVALGGTLTCARADPVASFSPAEQSGSAGSSASFLLTVENPDVDCPPAALVGSFSEIPAGWEQPSLENFEVTLGPGARRDVAFEVRSPDAADPGRYVLTIAVTNLDSGRTTMASATFILE